MNKTDSKRIGYVSGLRALADLLEKHDELPLPYTGLGTNLLWIETGKDQRRIAQTFARLIPGTITKNERGPDFDLLGHIVGVGVQLIVKRDAVCTRVVKGVREVSREVPDPDAIAAVPTVTVTETVEDIEWVCEPLLTERVSA